MIRVILFIDKWSSGGIETYLLSHLEKMDLKRYNVRIVTSKKISDVYDFRLESLGVELVELLNKEYSPALRNIVLVRAFRQFIKDNEADIIHYHIYNAISMIYCYLASSKIRIRILHSHNSDIEPSRMRGLKVAIHKISRNLFIKYSTHRWACSELAGDWLFGESDFEYKKNGILVDSFIYDDIKRNEFRLKNKIDSETIVLGTIGRMNTQKNQHFLLKLMKKMKIANQNCRLYIIGEGPLRTEIENFIEMNNLDNIILYGVTNDIQMFLSGIDIFLLPSLFEGNPVSAIEAQSSGVKTILSSKITKYAKILDNTEILDIGDIDEWYNSIIKSQANDNDSEELRREANIIVRESGYAVEDTAENITNDYYRYFKEGI